MAKELQKQISLKLDTSGESPKYLPPNLPTEPVRANNNAAAAGGADHNGATITVPNDLVVAVTRLVYGAGNNGAGFPAAGLQVDFERLVDGTPTTTHSLILAAQGPIIEHGSIEEPLVSVEGGTGAQVVTFRVVFRETADNPVPAGLRVFSNIEAHRIQPRTALVSGL